MGIRVLLYFRKMIKYQVVMISGRLVLKNLFKVKSFMQVILFHLSFVST